MSSYDVRALVILCGLACIPLVQAEEKAWLWPSFRGAGGYGHAIDVDPPTLWNGKEGTHILWKTLVERHGMSSPIVAGDCVFITAADHLARQVLCYDTDSGELLWHQEMNTVAEDDLPFVLEETGYAAPTPVTDGTRVAAIFATGELICVTVGGDRVWTDQLPFPKNHYGHASSLIGFGDVVIVQYDQEENAMLVAYQFATGKRVWEVKRDSISWSSPIVADNHGRDELILTNCKAVDSYAAKSGEHLWRVACLSGEVASSAAYADGIVFVASEGATAAAIDIREHAKEPKILWEWDDALPDASSPVATKDCLFVPTAFGTVTCLNAKTGAVHWEHEFDRGFNSSPILVDDRVYITDLSGTTQIFKASKTFEWLGAASMGEATYATPAFAKNRIFVRGLSHLYCISGETQK